MAGEARAGGAGAEGEGFDWYRRSHVWLAGVGEPEISRQAYEVIGGWLVDQGVAWGGGNKRIVVNGLRWIHMQTDGTLGAEVFCLSGSQAFHRMGPGRVAAACPAAVLVRLEAPDANAKPVVVVSPWKGPCSLPPHREDPWISDLFSPRD